MHGKKGILALAKTWQFCQVDQQNLRKLSSALLQQQVGGAGIGFGGSNHDDPMKELYGDRAEFTKGSDLASKAFPMALGYASSIWSCHSP